MAALGAVTNYYLTRREFTERPLPVLGVSLGVTICAYFITALVLGYVYGQVIGTLAAVEDPNSNVYVRLESDDAVESGISDVNKPPTKPITSSISGTITHLEARAGRLSRFHGIWLYIFGNIGAAVIILLVGTILGRLGSSLGTFIATLLLTSLEVAWIHIVISKPSNKSLWSRIPPFRKTYVKFALAATIRSVAAQLVISIMSSLMPANRIGQSPDRATFFKLLFGIFGVVALFLVLQVLITMPTQVIFIRMAASTLPEDDEPIIPLDRTFGCSITPENMGGPGRIGIVDAWRSFGRDSQKRVAKAVGWSFLIQLVALFTFASLITLQCYFLPF